jgi:hypothetical protein
MEKTSLHFISWCCFLIYSVRSTHTKKQDERSEAVSVVGISAERKSSLWMYDWTIAVNNSHEQDAKFECGLCHPLGFPFMSSATLPWQRHHAQGSFHTSRKPLAFLRSPDPCWDQVLLITWSSECFRVVHRVATTDGASFTPHSFLDNCENSFAYCWKCCDA